MKTSVNRIVEGDSLLELPLLPMASFDLLLTDPPYAMPATFYEGRGKLRHWSDSSILTGWFRAVVREVLPLLKPNAMMAVFANANAVAAFWPVLFEVTTNLQLGVWDKGEIGMGRPLRIQTEFIIIGSLGASWQRDLGTSNVFRVPRVHPKNRIHPAEKPGALIRELVEFLCPLDGAVLDPFAGSGVVHNACRKLGMDSTCIDWSASSIVDEPDLFVGIGA